MTLTYRQQRQLRHIEAGVRRTDPHLGAMLGIFCRLYPEKDLPAWEQEPRAPVSQSRTRRVGAWIVAALTAVVAAIEVLLGHVVTLATAGRRARAQVPATERGRIGPGQEADAPQDANRDRKPPRA